MEIKKNKIIFLNKEEIREQYEVFSKSGCNSIIYKYNEDTLLKIFHTPATLTQLEIVERIKKYDSIYFPKFLQYIEIARELYGYAMQLIEASRIEVIPNDIDILHFFNAFNDTLEKQIYLLAKDRIYLYDLKFDNVLFDVENNHITFLDNDGYLLHFSANIDEIYYSNLYSVLELVCSSFFGITLLSDRMVDIASTKLTQGKTLYESLCHLKSFLENHVKQELNTIGDFKRIKTLINQ